MDSLTTKTITRKEFQFYKSLHFYAAEIVRGTNVEAAKKGLARTIREKDEEVMSNKMIMETMQVKIDAGYCSSRIFDSINEITKSDKRTNILMKHLYN
tara:strand:- start:447 stop:740 length:294 start_codon:yes stop_codon:yes gene_type:complete